MTAPHADQLIDGYLARLNAAAADLPPSVRDELLDDMRAHIAEARTREPEETDATVLNILDRLGEPGTVVAEARRRPDAFESGPVARSYQPGILEIVALVLLPFLWPVGVILLWISPAWKLRDKVIGTLLPPGGYLGIFSVGLFAAHAAGGTSGDAAPVEMVTHVLTVILVVVLWLLPLITVGYLAIRLRWGRRLQAAIA